MNAPAPWTRSVEGASKVALVKDADGVPILRFYADRADEEAQLLAAAAPELRDALRMAIEALAGHCSDKRAVVTALAVSNAALAKAEAL